MSDTVNAKQLLTAYRAITKAALDLLAEGGWHTFGTHADRDLVPDLEFWGVDECGDPIFERAI